MRKLLIVSGGTKGIGRAIVQRFATEDFDIVTCARNGDELENLRSEYEARQGSKLYTFKADLSRREETGAFIQFIHSLPGTPEILVNNTGLFIPGQIHTEEEGVLEQMIETNLYSAYHLTRGVVGKMMERKHGYVFNICSTASITPYTNGGSYCISKYAMYGMTKVLREEMKPHNIKVTALLPGATLTSSWEGTDLPAERFMKPSDVAEMVLAVYKLSPNTVVEDILLRPQAGDIG